MLQFEIDHLKLISRNETRTGCKCLHEKQIEMLDVPLVELQFGQLFVRRVFQ